jgi:hypothetical protein
MSDGPQEKEGLEDLGVLLALRWDRFTGSCSNKSACLDLLYLGNSDFRITNISILKYELQLESITTLF